MPKNPFKKIKAITVFGGISTLAFLSLFFASPRFIEERLEAVLLDYRFHIRNLINPPKPPENIVIVEVDEKSLERYGRWPWSRTLQARLIRKILAGRPAVLAVDIFYPEKENRKADTALGNVLQEARGTVVLAAGFDRGEGVEQEVPDFLLDNAIANIKDQSRLSGAATVTRQKLSIPVLSSNAILGHVYSPADLDGKLRSEYLYIKYGDEIYPSFSLVTAARALGKDISDIVVYASRGVLVGDIYIPTDPAGRMRVNYLGGDRTFHYYSASDVMTGNLDTSALTNKIVFLGTSAISTFDFVVTPFSARMPGVEKNATVAENILNNRFLKNAPISVIGLIIIVTGIVLTLALPRVRAVPGVIVSVALMVLYAGLNQYLLSYHGIYSSFFYPFANIAAISMFGGTYKYLTEERKAREIKKMFLRYVSPKIVEQLLAHPEMAKLGGYRREITVLFSDVRGFTSFSETRQPEEVVIQLNEYLQEMTDIVFKWDGTLDKFVGDAIMAFWGAPLEQPDHAELAVKCALNMSDRLEQLQAKWRAEGKHPLDNGIGINTGPALIGNIGSADKKMDFTAIGDHVNLGARVESLTRKYDSRVLITEFTKNKIEHLIKDGTVWRVDMKELDTVKVKGKEIPVKIFGISTRQPLNPSS